MVTSDRNMEVVMSETETLFSRDDLPAAFGLLTRFPMRMSTRGARAAWAWPLVGVVVGALGILAAKVALLVGLPVAGAAIVALAVMAATTGAMHEDGLADLCDGLFGGHDREARLEIMKDSRIGTFGALGLVLVTLMRWNAVVVLLAVGDWTGIVAVAALSRVPMVVLMGFLPNARQGGLSRMTGRPDGQGMLLAVVIGLVIAILGSGFGVIALAAMTLMVTLGIGLLAQRKIGGQTGDILGASQQVSEALGLALLAGMVL